MPWCPTCEAYRAPSAVRSDGTCPGCDRPVDAGGLATRARVGAEGRVAGGRREHGEAARTPWTWAGDEESGEEEGLPPVPWHLKVLGVAVVAYLGLRAWQGIELLLDKL